MNLSPYNWTKAPIGSLCNLRNGRAFKPSEWQITGIPIVRIQNLNNTRAGFNYFSGDFEKKHVLKSGDLLFAWSGTPGTSFGAHIWNGGEALLNQHIFRVDFDEALLERRFFRHAINQKLTEIIGVAHGGAGLQHVTKGVFEKTEVDIPPRAEQTRIADKLDIVLAGVDAANARLSRVTLILKRFRQSVLAAATSGRLTEEWRDGNAADWAVERADFVCEKVQSGGTPKVGFSDGGIPFLKVYNIVDQKIDFEYKSQYVSEAVHAKELQKSKVLPRDVLMNIVGPPLGKIAIVPVTHAEWNINQAIALFRSSKRVLADWIYIVLCEGKPIREVLASTKGSVGQVNISLSQCRAFEFPVPSIDEQVEIVRRVETLFAFADRLETRLKIAQTTVDRLTPSLLAKAFRGELVPQDPNDEPAAELLKRLCAASSDVTTKPARKRRTA